MNPMNNLAWSEICFIPLPCSFHPAIGLAVAEGGGEGGPRSGMTVSGNSLARNPMMWRNNDKASARIMELMAEGSTPHRG